MATNLDFDVNLSAGDVKVLVLPSIHLLGYRKEKFGHGKQSPRASFPEGESKVNLVAEKTNF